VLLNLLQQWGFSSKNPTFHPTYQSEVSGPIRRHRTKSAVFFGPIRHHGTTPTVCIHLIISSRGFDPTGPTSLIELVASTVSTHRCCDSQGAHSLVHGSPRTMHPGETLHLLRRSLCHADTV